MDASVTDHPRSGQPEPAQHGRQGHVPVRHDGESPALRRERLECGRGVRECRERHGVGQARQQLGAVCTQREHVREDVRALEPQARERRGIVRAEDVTFNNTVLSYNVADATIQISFGNNTQKAFLYYFDKHWEQYYTMRITENSGRIIYVTDGILVGQSSYEQALEMNRLFVQKVIPVLQGKSAALDLGYRVASL